MLVLQRQAMAVTSPLMVAQVRQLARLRWRVVIQVLRLCMRVPVARFTCVQVPLTRLPVAACICIVAVVALRTVVQCQCLPLPVARLAAAETFRCALEPQPVVPVAQSPLKVVYRQPDTVELFDLLADEWELHNVAAVANYSAVVASLHERLHAWYGCAGASCPQ